MSSLPRLTVPIFILLIISLVLSSILIYRLFPPNQTQAESATNEAQSVSSNCRNSQQAELCYSQLMGTITKEKGFDHAWKLLGQLQQIDPATRGCHLIAHYMSNAEASKDIAKWEDTLAKMPVSACSGGFVHGVIEARQKYDRTFVINTHTIPQICEIIKQKTGSPGSDINCAHIMGHLSLDKTKGNIGDAINLCESLPSAMLYECASGVYMENETRDNVAADGYLDRIPWNSQTTADQEGWCKAETNPTAITACWRELAHMYAFIDHNDPTQVYKDCTKAPNHDAITECYRHAIGVMTGSSTFSESNMKYICQPYLTSEKDFRLCYINAVGSMLSGSSYYTERAIALCNVLPLSNSEECYQQIGTRLSATTSSDERKKLCSSAPDIYKALCVGGS